MLDAPWSDGVERRHGCVGGPPHYLEVTADE
jgi:hypothetical protein